MATEPVAAPRRHRARWIAVAVAVPVALLVGVLASSPPAGTRAADSPLIGKPAPALDATTIDGERVTSEQLRGRWTVVNFFATWCVPCRQEHPELLRFARQHQAAGDVQIVAVVYDDSVDAVRKFRDQEGMPWPLLVDPKGRIALDYGVAGVPESYLVGPDGRVAAKVIGGVQAAALDALLQRVKSEAPSVP